MVRLWFVAICVLLLAGVPARAAQPSLSFLGIYDAVESETAAVRQLEGDLARQVAGWNEFAIRLSPELDREIGRATRVIILSSRNPGILLSENAKALNTTYALRITYRERQEIATVWKLPEGSEFWSETVHHGQTSSALERLRARINEIEQAAAAEAQAAALKDVGFQAPATRVAMKLHHRPVREMPPHMPAMIEATIECDCQYEAVVHYRRAGTTNWLTANLVATGENHKYVTALAPMAGGQLEYYISVFDNDLEQLGSDGNAQQPHVIDIRPPSVTPTAPMMTQPPSGPTAPEAKPKVEEGSATQPLPPAALKPVAPSNRTGWIVTGSGGALLAGSVVLAVLAQRERSLIRNGELPTGAAIEESAARYQRLNVVALSTGVVGALVTGWGIKMLLTHEETAR